jgi:glycosyltransferase 2 family protein
MKEKIKKYKRLFQLIISLALATYIYSRIDYKSFRDSFEMLPWYILLIVPVIGLVQIYVTTIIQIKLFSTYSTSIGKAKTFEKNFVAAFVGMAVPGLIGSDLYLVNYFGKKINSYFIAFTGIFFLRIIGLMVFITLIIISFFFLNKTTYQLISNFDLDFKKSIITIVLALIFVSIIGLLGFRKYFRKYYIKFISKLNPLLDLIKIERSKIFLIIFQIIIYYIVAIGGRALLAKIAGIELSVAELSALIMIVNVLIMLPISYNGIGVREGGYIGLLVLLNIDKNKAILFSMMDFSIAIFVISIGSLITLISLLIKKRRTSSET